MKAVRLIWAACFISASVATPVPVLEVIDFDDPWDYELSPHNNPLLKTSSKYHHLPSAVKRMSKDLYDEEDLQVLEEDSHEHHALSCFACNFAVTLLRNKIDNGSSIEEIKKTFVSVCIGFNIQVEKVCAGAFDCYAPVVLPALKMSTLEKEKICSLLLGELCDPVENPLHEWVIDFPNKSVDDDVWKTPPRKEDVPTFKVLQLSDTHFDPQYVENSTANCQEPLCCRSDSSLPAKGKPVIPAGKWGAYARCDCPQSLLENMLSHIAERHPDIDYIMLTGDMPPHDVWNQTKKDNLWNIHFTLSKILEYFPNTLILPAMGNHEGIPAGNNPPPWMRSKNQSVDWLYDMITKEWSKWLPNEVEPTIHHGAYYSVLIRDNFRLISINTNYCYALSWWLVLNSTDPAHELKWLARELQMAEDNGEKVHIIGHVPPGSSDCLKIWSRNYYDVINRYKDTVVAQFFGHTHTDEFEVFYDNKEFKEPIGIAYIGPSVTTFEHQNPGYRMYFVDGDHEGTTREVIDHETWIMDLGKANENPDQNPEWFRLYSARSAYGMNTLRPAEWANLIDLMVKDSKQFDRFHMLSYKASRTRPPCTTNKCRFKKICELKSGKSHETKQLCHEEEEILLKKKD